MLELATLLVQNTSVDLHPGGAATSSILFDMNDVFEDFVWAAIGDELRRILPTNYRWRQGKSIALDEDRTAPPRARPVALGWTAVRLCRRREVQGDRTRRSRRPLPATRILLRDRARRGPSPLRREAVGLRASTESSAAVQRCAWRPSTSQRLSTKSREVQRYRVGDRSDCSRGGVDMPRPRRRDSHPPPHRCAAPNAERQRQRDTPAKLAAAVGTPPPWPPLSGPRRSCRGSSRRADIVFTTRSRRGLRRRVLLARLSRARHLAEAERRLVAREDRSEPAPRSRHRRGGLERPAGR